MNKDNIKNSKKLRKNILEILYKNREKVFLDTNKLKEGLKNKGFDVSDKEIHKEVKYLQGKYYLETASKHTGKYLNYPGLKITSQGIDLVEDPEEFNKLFSINVTNMGNVSGSNVNINSQNNIQNLDFSDENLDEDVKKLLENLSNAIENKDENKAIDILSQIKEGSKTVFWNLLSSGILRLFN